MDPGADTKRLVTWIVVALVAVGVVMAIGMAYGGGASWMGGWAWMMPFGMMLMWVPIILIVLLVYHLVGLRSPETGSSEPDRLLDARYARGEVPREEYLRMREDLRAGRNR